MMHYTHLAFGLFAALFSLEFFNIKYKLLFILVSLFFSIFPDIDEPKSKIGRKNKFFSKVTGFLFGHRGFLHTVYIPIILSLIFYSFSKEIGIGVIIGYFSHLLMDSLTKQGISPFYPLLNMKINGVFKTNSLFEKILFVMILFFDFYLALSLFMVIR